MKHAQFPKTLSKLLNNNNHYYMITIIIRCMCSISTQTNLHQPIKYLKGTSRRNLSLVRSTFLILKTDIYIRPFVQQFQTKFPNIYSLILRLFPRSVWQTLISILLIYKANSYPWDDKNLATPFLPTIHFHLLEITEKI